MNATIDSNSILLTLLLTIFLVVVDLPNWDYDGSSTNQATGQNSDTFLFPQAIYKDPFRRGNNILVMCDTYKYNYEPTGEFNYIS